MFQEETRLTDAYNKANNVGSGANSYAATVGTGANTYAVSATAGANAYMITVQNGSNTAVGVIAQEVEKVLPQVVKLAPFDIEYIDGTKKSKSGENYKTVQYEKLIPLLIEAIKEQNNKIDYLQEQITKLLTGE
jgi:hypothetical protein